MTRRSSGAQGLQGLLRRGRGAARRRLRGRRGRRHRAARRQRRRQDDDAARDLGDDPLRRRARVPRRAADARAANRRRRAARRRACARRPRHLHGSDGRGKPAARRLYAARPARGAQATSTACSAISPASPSGCASRRARCRAANSRCWRFLARCLMRPSLLLLDEPSFGLAPLIVAEIFRILERNQPQRRRQHAASSSRTPTSRSISPTTPI